MGTQHTMRHKLNFTYSHVKRCFENNEDILVEQFIGFLMLKLACERRKAWELVKAAVSQFPYELGKLEGKKAYLIKNKENFKQMELSEEEEEILHQ